MRCCKDSQCDDHLDVPAGAIAANDQYEVTQKFPFLCSKDEESDYRVICVKEYHVLHDRRFAMHVEIVAHFTTTFDSDQLRVRRSNDNKSYEEVYCWNNSDSNNLPETYFIVQGNKLTIYTKHFSEYIVEKKKWRLKLLSISPKNRVVELFISAYLSVDNKNKHVVLRVYIWDKNHAQCETLKRLAEEKESKNEPRRNCYIDYYTLQNLPDTITEETTFQCLVLCCKSKWKSRPSTQV